MCPEHTKERLPMAGMAVLWARGVLWALKRVHMFYGRNEKRGLV